MLLLIHRGHRHAARVDIAHHAGVMDCRRHGRLHRLEGRLPYRERGALQDGERGALGQLRVPGVVVLPRLHHEARAGGVPCGEATSLRNLGGPARVSWRGARARVLDEGVRRSPRWNVCLRYGSRVWAKKKKKEEKKKGRVGAPKYRRPPKAPRDSRRSPEGRSQCQGNRWVGKRLVVVVVVG